MKAEFLRATVLKMSGYQVRVSLIIYRTRAIGQVAEMDEGRGKRAGALARITERWRLE